MTKRKYEKIDPEMKTAWLQALRSGRYRQATGSLKCEVDDDGTKFVGHCCLGVLGEEIGMMTQKCNASGEYGFRPIAKKKAVSAATLLLDTNYKHIILNEATQSKLAEMNDSGKSFSVIADWIEKTL